MSLLVVIQAIEAQVREVDGEARVYVAESGMYRESTRKQLNLTGVKWVSLVSETLTEAKTLMPEGSEGGPESEDGPLAWFARDKALPQGSERWVVVRPQASLQRVPQTIPAQVQKPTGHPPMRWVFPFF